MNQGHVMCLTFPCAAHIHLLKAGHGSIWLPEVQVHHALQAWHVGMRLLHLD